MRSFWHRLSVFGFQELLCHLPHVRVAALLGQSFSGIPRRTAVSARCVSMSMHGLVPFKHARIWCSW